MSLFGLFDISKSAIFASQAALTTTSHNIANANTAGYTRQEVVLDIANPVSFRGGSIGRGVTVSGIKRNYDSFLQSQIIGQNQNQGRSTALDSGLSQIEQLFNEAQGMGLSQSMTDYFNAWNDVITNPEGQAQRTALLQKANALVLTAKQMESGMVEAQKQTNKAIDDLAGQVNSIASQIADLNDKIMQIEAGGSTDKANDLRDQRDNLMNQLGNLTDFTSFEADNGSVTIMVGMRNLVYANKTNALSTAMNSDGTNDLYLDNTNITSNVTKGQLGGLIALRDEVSSGPLFELRKLVASITKEVNLLHGAGFGLDGTTGNNFFSPLQVTTQNFSAGASISSASISNLSQVTLDEYDITFSGANYSVSDKQSGSIVATGLYTSGSPITFWGIQVTITGVVTDADKFTISPLTGAVKNFGVAINDPKKVAAASSNATLPGDNTTATAIANLADASVGNLGDSFMNYYNGIVSNVGTMSKAASDSLKFDENMLSELNNKRDSVSGVSLDEETVNLIRFQRSYEAGARMIKVTDELLQTILNL